MFNIIEIKNYLEEKKFHNSVTSSIHLFKKYPELKNIIDTSDVKKDVSGQLYCLINNVEYPKCNICNEYFHFISFKKGFLKNCKNKCSNKFFTYDDVDFKKINKEILICKKHDTFVSERIFNGLKENKVECLCINCAREIRQKFLLDEEISKKTKNNLKEKFKNRKKFAQDYIENHYPYTYNKILTIQDVYPNNFFSKLNYFLYDYNLKCSNINCNNLIHFNKSNKPKQQCESCSRSFSGKTSKDITSKLYWKLYIKQNFKNITNNLEIELKNNKLLSLKNYCKHLTIIDIFKLTIKLLKNRGVHSLCMECNKEYYRSLDSIDVNILKQNWETIKTLSEEKMIIYNPYIWALIDKKMREQSSSFSEAKYMLKYDIIERPKCNVCEKQVKFSDDAYAYLQHCEDHKFNYFVSKYEGEVSDFLQKYNIKVLNNVRNLIYKELDIFLPEKNIAIEINGVYWHSESYILDKNQHYKKWKACRDKNIKLITIWEDDWNNKKDILKSIILNECKISEFKRGARECEIKLVDADEKKNFLIVNHLQGTCASSINLGLYYKNELVSLMTFGAKRKIMKQNNIENEYELLRFCSKLNYQVNGAASKLFTYFIKNFKPYLIISYASCDISDGNLYETLGFKFINHTGLNYWWAKNGVKYHRSNFMKHKLIKNGEDKNKTEDEIMKQNGYVKLWGTGNLKYEYLLT
jgi:hypothetical protein